MIPTKIEHIEKKNIKSLPTEISKSLFFFRTNRSGIKNIKKRFTKRKIFRAPLKSKINDLKKQISKHTMHIMLLLFTKYLLSKVEQRFKSYSGTNRQTLGKIVELKLRPYFA